MKKYCLDCKERSYNCHSCCEKYQEYLKELNKIKNEIKKDNITKRNRRKY